MYTITLEYLLGEDIQEQTIDTEHETKTQGKVVIGRDPASCDFVVTDDTNRVSRQHIEIYQESPKNNYLIVKNLTANRSRPNPIIVDKKTITDKAAKISSGTKIKLGNLVIRIKAINWHSQKASEEAVFGVECINGHRISLKYLNSFCPHCGYAVQASRTIAE
jgi:predicted component of type VI protein secretion system